MQKLIPLSTVAVNLGIKPETLRRKVRAGQISAYKIGKAWHFSENAIDSFLRECLSSTSARLVHASEQPLKQGAGSPLSATPNAGCNICAAHSALRTNACN